MRTCSTRNAAAEDSPGRDDRRRALVQPLWLGLATLGLAVAAQLHLSGRLPLPSCLWRKFWGIPCPSCGVTRSLAAWTQLDPAAAFRFHPLCFLACLTLLAWAGLALLDRWTGRHHLAALGARAERWPIWRALAALAVLNWAYLILTLPR